MKTKYGVEYLLEDIAFPFEKYLFEKKECAEEKTRETSCQNRAINRYSSLAGYHLAMMEKLEKLMETPKKESVCK